MEECIDKLGELFVQYDNILDEYNIMKICSYYLEKNEKIIDLCDIMLNKYHENLSNELLNYLVYTLCIIYDNNSNVKNKDKCFKSIEKIIEEYTGSLTNKNLKIYINMVVNLYKK